MIIQISPPGGESQGAEENSGDENSVVRVSAASDVAEQIRDTLLVYGFLSDRLRALSRTGITALAAQLDYADLVDLDRTRHQLKRVRRALADRIGEP